MVSLSLAEQVLRQIETVGDRVHRFDAKLHGEAMLALEHAVTYRDTSRILELVDHAAAAPRREVLRAWFAKVAPLEWIDESRARWLPRDSERYVTFDLDRARATPLP